MKAAVYGTYGPPEVVTIRDIPKPTPKQNEVLVKVHTTLVTSGDARMRAFDIPALFRIPGRFMLGWPKPREQVLGFCFSGVVDAVGPGVTSFKPGDEVMGGKVNGAHAEYAAVPAGKGIIAKPPGLSFEAAATVAFGPTTALTFLRNAKIGPGTRLLVIGASGSVGVYAVQIGRHLGADVTAVCSGANAELVTALGASRVIDYTKQDIRKLGETFDVVFETVGSMNFVEALPLLAPTGTFATAVMAPADIWPMLWPPARKGRRIVGGEAEATNDKMTYLADLMASGALQPVIDSRYKLDTIRDAHARVDTKRKRGDILVAVS
ncbi:MAG: NAD(P)-dependent alcohol dehydrogenase [Devosia nanyangense]|uniref:NAD(P)-dependent alcohol dehydrogenase n=1 Tax=Devosia nanyangense TaxID=1228055 RepID=A0A933NXF9_9HYPH|nr:NAD(P)-dependent alcohol dehydrogenase [Devosia nanyangense]